ncbi:fatty acyl-AMP ligase [Nocardia sp. NBC_00881]|uniref:fatty acyl-AMP ligase n=1 Tax=Nocardia sp. NBC_00881 TaxID=2975995 RepID=UPI003864554F|nr:fatty acyl-AMP ligase [Nocardia sp. NBC_00881]
MPDATAYIDRFRNNVQRSGDKEALIFLDVLDGAVVESALSYSDLDCRARAVAVVLRSHLTPGERALLLYPPGPDFVVGFLGALMAGVVAVPAPVPDGRATGQERLTRIALDAGVTAVLTSATFAPLVRSWASDLPSDPWVLATDSVAVENAADWFAVDIDGETDAFLQYTSGSTSEPKGVIVTHENLGDNQREIGAALGTDENIIVCGWLPQFHDMGLIGMTLHPLWCGASLVFMSPVTFLKRPRRWLEALHRYRATITLAPNFAFDYVVRRVRPETIRDLDFSSVATVLTGAEPVQAASIHGFVDLLSPCGLKPQAMTPVYGLAEATLFVTGTPISAGSVEFEASARLLAENVLEEAIDATDTRRLVSSGRPQSLDVAIVDPNSGSECAPHHVGEIWVHGRSVARGYWNMPEESAHTFDGRLRGHGGWLRTGDLGAMLDGHLFVTGRIKDTIILNGRNLYAHDIESAARRASPAVASGVGAAFAVDSPERLVLVHEIDPGLLEADTVESLSGRICAVIWEESSAAVSDLLLVSKGAVARTSSGKIRRTRMRELYETGGIMPIATTE